jgi:hypothetical protein
MHLLFSEHLQKPLEKYFRDYPKVKIVRSPVRGGLTKARIRGFDVSTGEVVVFLDSHIECTEGESVGWPTVGSCFCSMDYISPLKVERTASCNMIIQ